MLQQSKRRPRKSNRKSQRRYRAVQDLDTIQQALDEASLEKYEKLPAIFDDKMWWVDVITEKYLESDRYLYGEDMKSMVKKFLTSKQGYQLAFPTDPLTRLLDNYSFELDPSYNLSLYPILIVDKSSPYYEFGVVKPVNAWMVILFNDDGSGYECTLIEQRVGGKMGHTYTMTNIPYEKINNFYLEVWHPPRFILTTDSKDKNEFHISTDHTIYQPDVVQLLKKADDQPSFETAMRLAKQWIDGYFHKHPNALKDIIEPRQFRPDS